MSNGPTMTIVGDFGDLPTASYRALAKLLLAMTEPEPPEQLLAEITGEEDEKVARYREIAV